MIRLGVLWVILPLTTVYEKPFCVVYTRKIFQSLIRFAIPLSLWQITTFFLLTACLNNFHWMTFFIVISSNNSDFSCLCKSILCYTLIITVSLSKLNKKIVCFLSFSIVVISYTFIIIIHLFVNILFLLRFIFFLW